MASEELTAAERERLASWSLLSQIARQRGAGSALPGNFAPDVEAEYQRLRAAYEQLRREAERGVLDPVAHERFRASARALLGRLGPS